MGQAKMTRRCFPIKKGFKCLSCTPERQNLNASQTEPGKSVYQDELWGHQDSGDTRQCSHKASLTLLDTRPTTPGPQMPHPSSSSKRCSKSSSPKTPLFWWEISLQVLESVRNHGQLDPCPSEDADLFGYIPHLFSRLTSDNPHSARIPHLHHWIIPWRFVMGRQVDGRIHTFLTFLLLQGTQISQ